mgnify:CR=1 FL=1
MLCCCSRLGVGLPGGGCWRGPGWGVAAGLVGLSGCACAGVLGGDGGGRLFPGSCRGRGGVPGGSPGDPLSSPFLVFPRAVGGRVPPPPFSPGSLSWAACLLCSLPGWPSGAPGGVALGARRGLFSWVCGVGAGGAVPAASALFCPAVLFACSTAGLRGAGRLGLSWVSSARGACWRRAGRLLPARPPPASPASRRPPPACPRAPLGRGRRTRSSP